MIPYATTVLDDRLGPVRVCPVCEEKLREEFDLYGQVQTSNYEEHYEAEHEGDCVYCGTFIRQSSQDRAWEDEKGACGCGAACEHGDGEHEPAVDYCGVPIDHDAEIAWLRQRGVF